MEPNGGRRRPNRMFADTDAIHSLGSAAAGHAADLADVAATMAAVPGPGTADMLGPVGAGFLAALTAAAADEARAVAAVSERLANTGATAHVTAIAYTTVDHDAGALIAGR